MCGCGSCPREGASDSVCWQIGREPQHSGLFEYQLFEIDEVTLIKILEFVMVLCFEELV